MYDMSCVFDGCKSLKELNIINFDTSNVTNMHRMFAECRSLKELNITDFNTVNVTDIEYIFYYCSKSLQMKMKKKH